MRKKFSQVYTLTGLAKILIISVVVALGSNGWAALSADLNPEDVTSSQAIHLNSDTRMMSGGYGIDTTRLTLKSDGSAEASGGGFLPARFRMPSLHARFNDNASAAYSRVAAQIAQFSSHFRAVDERIVPEPSSVIAAGLLLVPLGVNALRIIRKR